MHLAQATTKVRALCSIVGEGKCPLVGKRGLGIAAPPAEQVGTEGGIEVVTLAVQRVDQAKRGVRTLHLGEGYRAIQLYNRARSHDQELVVELEDLPPIGLGGAACVAVHGLDRGLQLVGPGPIDSQTAAHQLLSLRDEIAIPKAAVLIDEQDQVTVGSDSRLTPRVDQKHE